MKKNLKLAFKIKRSSDKKELSYSIIFIFS